MHHRKSGKKLNRNSSHRKAMFRNMSASLLKHELIKTTLIKAKELRRFVEPLITIAKIDSLANRRLAFDRLRDKEAVAKLFTRKLSRVLTFLLLKFDAHVTPNQVSFLSFLSHENLFGIFYH